MFTLKPSHTNVCTLLLDHMETWPYKCLYSIRLLDHKETWPYKCLYSIQLLDHKETWPDKCLCSIAQSYGNLAIQMPVFYPIAPLITWKPGHTNVCILFDHPIIWKPGHTNACILKDRSIIWKPGHTNVCILSAQSQRWTFPYNCYSLLDNCFFL